jgi:plastocyanin
MKRALWLLVVLVALGSAAQASARTWTVLAGEPNPGKPPAGVPKTVSLNQFLPSGLTIHAGDKVKFTTKAFHTASFLGTHSRSEFPLAFPDPAKTTYSGIPNDAAGNPFWFNGMAKFIYNPGVFTLTPTGSPAVTDANVHSSGLLFGGPPGQSRGSFTFSFPKTGTYKVICLVHPGMQGKIVVKPAGAPIATPKAAQARVAKQLAASWVAAKALAAKTPPANTVYVGEGGKTTLLTFLPAKLTVKAGTTVTFLNDSPSEPHNVAFGPRDWLQPFEAAVDLFPLGPPGQTVPNQFAPYFVYGSEAPGGYTYTGTNHGNGVLLTPLTDDQPGDPPAGLPGSVQVTFTVAGTYHYYCQIHGPTMSGDIEVTP